MYCVDALGSLSTGAGASQARRFHSFLVRRDEPLQDRRKRLARLLRPPRGKAAENIASGIVLSEGIEGSGETIFREACRMG
jgi:hypothetical protein